MTVRQRVARSAKPPRPAPDAGFAPSQWHEPRWSAPAARARLVHQVPGRVRIRFDGIDDDEFYEALHDLLSGLPGVTSVRVNAAARSAVVSYDPEQQGRFAGIESHPAIGQLLEESGLAEGAFIDEAALERGLFALERHSQLAEAIVATAERFDASLRRASDGYLDLKVLFPITMAAFSTVHKARTKGTPMWMTLCTFAFNAFMSLHRNRLEHGSPQAARSTLAPR